MLFKAPVLDAIAEGKVDLAFRRAPELAARLGRETLSFKTDVRKLKALGLTVSLGVGYRLSHRGEVLMSRRLQAAAPGAKPRP